MSTLPTQKKIVLLTAPVLSRSGYGEHARIVYESLIKYEDILEIKVWLSNWGHTPNDLSYLDTYPFLRGHITPPGEVETLQYDIGIWVGIPNEFPKVHDGNQSHLVGITAGIETDIIDDSWAKVPVEFNRICVVSDHAKSGFITHARRNKTGLEEPYNKNIKVIPYPVKNLDLRKEDHILDTMDIETEFNFLSVAQLGPRKNMDFLLRCFVEEFRDNEDVGLILKANLVNNSQIDKEQCMGRIAQILAAYPKRKCKIHHIHGNLSEPELHSLYLSDKVKGYVTTTHGEGFGLPIFEAAYSGLPVIAPAWSGHMDFLYAPVTNKVSKREKRTPLFTKLKYELKKVPKEVVWENIITAESRWAYCDEKDTKKKLRSFYEKNKGTNRSSDKKNAELLKAYLEENFTRDKILEMYEKEILTPAQIVENSGEIKEWSSFLSEMIE